jgi:hypothetical protein
MTVNLSALAGAGQQFFDNNGVILTGGKLYSYAAGTTTPQATYTSASGSTAHTNPIILNSAGRIATGEIWLTSGSSYKFVLYTSADVLIATWDNISSIGDDTTLLAYEAAVAASTGSSLVGYLPSGANATATTVQAKLRQYVSVKDFGAVGDGVTDDTAAIQNAIAAVNTAGGGTIWFPTGVYATLTGITIGNGTNTTVSTKDHRITLKGAGSGTGTDITNVQFDGATVIRYTGTAASVGVVNIEGPVTQVQMFDMQLDCNGAAEFGLYQNHLYAGTFQNINVVNFTAVAYYLTTRTGFPVGCAYGNADNRYIGCYSNNPDSFNTTAIVLTSGVNSATSLNGNPDTARCTFIGGSYIYGGNTTYHGVLLNGADNNTFIEILFFAANGSSGGYDIYFQQWAGSGNFPLENYFANIGMNRGVSGNSGVGSSYGNMMFPYNTSDGAAFPPAVTGVSGGDQLGRTFVAGVRSYRGRQISLAESQTTRSTTSNTFVDVTDYSLTLTTLASTKLKIEFSGSAIKNTAGEGYFVIDVDGTNYGASQSIISSPGFYQNVTGIYLVDVNAGSHTVKIQFRSSDANSVSIVQGTLIVQELY